MDVILQVDTLACRGHGLCAEVAPELVRLDDWGYPVAPGRPVPRDLERAARRAVDVCPNLALRLRQAAPRERVPAHRAAGADSRRA